MDEKNWAAVAAQASKEVFALVGRLVLLAVIAGVVVILDYKKVGDSLREIVTLYRKLVVTSAKWERAAVMWLIRWFNGPAWGKAPAPPAGGGPAPKVPFFRRRYVQLVLLCTVYVSAAAFLNAWTHGGHGLAMILLIVVGALATGATALFGLAVWALVRGGGFTVDLVQRPVFAGVGALRDALKNDREGTASSAPVVSGFADTKAWDAASRSFAYVLVMSMASFVFWNLLFRSIPVFFVLYIIGFGIVALAVTGKLGNFIVREGLRWYYRVLATAIVLSAIAAVFASFLPTTAESLSSGTGLDKGISKWLGNVGTFLTQQLGQKAVNWIEFGLFAAAVIGFIALVVKLLTMKVPTKEEAAQAVVTESGGSGAGAVVAVVLVLAAVGSFVYFMATRTPTTPVVAATTVAVAAPVAAPLAPAPVQHAGVSMGAANAARVAYVVAHAADCPQTAANSARYGDPRLACRAETVQIRLQRLAEQ